MTVTTLDPKTALIVVDLQKGILSRVSADAIAAVIENAVALLDAFRKHKLPVVFVNVTGVAPRAATKDHGCPEVSRQSSPN